MGSLDLTDAYYSVSISPELQKYLQFQVQDQLYKINLLACLMVLALHREFLPNL